MAGGPATKGGPLGTEFAKKDGKRRADPSQRGPGLARSAGRAGGKSSEGCGRKIFLRLREENLYSQSPAPGAGITAALQYLKHARQSIYW